MYNAMKGREDKFKERSARAKVNRRAGNASGCAPASHCAGSVSVTQRAKKLAKGGKLSDATDVFLDTHFKKQLGKEPVPISQKAKEVMDKYTQNLSESQASGSETDPNQVFFDTVGGFQKGEVLGFGKEGPSLYYERTSRRRHV